MLDVGFGLGLGVDMSKLVLLWTMCLGLVSCATTSKTPVDIEYISLKGLVGAINRADSTSITQHQGVPSFYSDIRELNVSEFPESNTFELLMKLDKVAPGAARLMALRWHDKATQANEYAARRKWGELSSFTKEKRSKYFREDLKKLRVNYYSKQWRIIREAILKQLRASGV